MKTTGAVLVKAVCLTFLFFNIQNQAMAASGSNATNEPLPEEITVTGQKLFRVLEAQIRDAEDQMYLIFNEINADDQFDIHCFWRRPTGTRIRERRCMPAFFSNAMRDLAKDDFSQVSTHSAPIMSVMNHYYPLLEAKMKAAAEQSPDFLEAVARHQNLREQLEAKQATHFADWNSPIFNDYSRQ